jgi:hypothetical protein
MRLSSEPFVSDLDRTIERVTLTRRPSPSEPLCRLHRQFARIPEFSFLPQAQYH